MTKTAVDIMLAHFANVFGPPPSPSTEAFFGTFRRVIGVPSESVVRRATELFFRDNTISAWPQPATVLRYIKIADEEMARRNELTAPRQRLEAPRRSVEQRARVNELAMETIRKLRAAQLGVRP